MTTDGVLLLHGIARTSWAMRPLVRPLEADGYSCLALENPPRKMDLAGLAEFVETAAAPWAAGINGRVHLVGFSLGGLVSRVLLARHVARQSSPPTTEPSMRLGRTVLLAPPNNGREIADALAGLRLYRRLYGPAGGQLGTRRDAATAAMYGSAPVGMEVGVIAGTRSLDPIGWLFLPKPNDGKVSLASTRLDGAADHLVLPATHTFIASNPAVIRATQRFLRSGRFAS